jgi:hypothetical protein
MLFPHPYKILNPFHSTICGLTCMTSRYPEHGLFIPSLQCVPRICFEIITSHVLVSMHYSWLPQGKSLFVIWETLPGGISHSWGCHPFLWKILCEQALWCRRSHSHSHYCWGRTMAVDHGHSSVVTPGKALLSGYYALGREAKFPGHNPWQQCLPVYRSSYLWTIVVTAGQWSKELKDRILLHRERTPKETIISLKCDLESQQLSIDRDLMSFILVTMQLLSESIVSWLPHT